jgi:hypothetical protein
MFLEINDLLVIYFLGYHYEDFRLGGKVAPHVNNSNTLFADPDSHRERQNGCDLVLEMHIIT